MNIASFQRLTLIDYPGKIAATVFTVGCSFRCPFCHNPELVVHGAWSMGHGTKKTEKEFFNFLKTRKGKLEGVCVTGGEPTIQSNIINFIKKIKVLGYAVKLDTNGTRPDILKKIIDQSLVDFIAMDIKNEPDRYDETTGVKGDVERIKLSVKLIMHGKIPYEFRTTAVPGIHTERDFLAIAKWISGAQTYWLQTYRETKILDPKLKRKTKNKKLNLAEIKQKIKKNFNLIGIRE